MYTGGERKGKDMRRMLVGLWIAVLIVNVVALVVGLVNGQEAQTSLSQGTIALMAGLLAHTNWQLDWWEN